MTTLSTHVTSIPATIPLLDASDLPYADDWAVLEAIAGDGEFGIDADRADFMNGGAPTARPPPTRQNLIASAPP